MYKQRADLYYAVRTRLLKLSRAGVSTVMLDTTFSITDPIGEVTSSSVRSPVILCLVRPLAVAHMVTILSHIFTIQVDQWPASVTEALELLKGRPLFFFDHFLPHLWSSVCDCKPTSLEQLTPLIMTAIDNAAQRSVLRMAAIITSVIEWPHQYCRTSPEQPVRLMVLLLRAYLLGDGNLKLMSADLTSLMNWGLTSLPEGHYHSAKAQNELPSAVNLGEEPLMYKGVQAAAATDVGMNCVVRHTLDDNMDKGDVLEEWTILALVIAARQKPGACLAHQLLLDPSQFQRDSPVFTHGLVASHGTTENDGANFLSKWQWNEATGSLVFKPPNIHRTDVLVWLQPLDRSQDKPAVLLAQCKNRAKLDLQDALETTVMAFGFTPPDAIAVLRDAILQNKLPDITTASNRGRLGTLMSQSRQLRAGWLKSIPRRDRCIH
eukprot:GILJ01008369.1.p1 GENE.GILJ01008369.1~~GILJ01008369.1.p1  ORF type:complete len:435 (+),score=41.00 GILJ01008369.1:1059-2363(+)